MNMSQELSPHYVVDISTDITHLLLRYNIKVGPSGQRLRSNDPAAFYHRLTRFVYGWTSLSLNEKVVLPIPLKGTPRSQWTNVRSTMNPSFMGDSAGCVYSVDYEGRNASVLSMFRPLSEQGGNSFWAESRCAVQVMAVAIDQTWQTFAIIERPKHDDEVLQVHIYGLSDHDGCMVCSLKTPYLPRTWAKNVIITHFHVADGIFGFVAQEPTKRSEGVAYTGQWVTNLTGRVAAPCQIVSLPTDDDDPEILGHQAIQFTSRQTALAVWHSAFDTAIYLSCYDFTNPVHPTRLRQFDLRLPGLRHNKPAWIIESVSLIPYIGPLETNRNVPDTTLVYHDSADRLVGVRYIYHLENGGSTQSVEVFDLQRRLSGTVLLNPEQIGEVGKGAEGFAINGRKLHWYEALEVESGRNGIVAHVMSFEITSELLLKLPPISVGSKGITREMRTTGSLGTSLHCKLLVDVDSAMRVVFNQDCIMVLKNDQQAGWDSDWVAVCYLL